MATIAGQWVGLGLGDADPEVGRIRDFMRRKFRSYAGSLPDTRNPRGVPLFDAPMTEATLVMQRAYVRGGTLKPQFANGFIGASTKVAMGYLKATPVDIRPMLFTVCGTGVPWWVGPDADTARAVETLYKWQPVGYPAQPFPMGPSIAAGKAELRNQFNMHRAQVVSNGFAVASYSQGAVAASEVWEFDIKPAAGVLHWAYPHFRRAVTWGNPSRELGRAWPDGTPEPVAPAHTSGVAHPDDRLKNTPTQWRDYAHKGDLYTTGSNDAAGQDKTAIWRIIRGEDFFVGPDTLLEQFLEIAKQPIPGAVGAFKAILDAGMFIGRGLTPHTNYSTQPAIAFLRS
ncbi:MAG: hypothetical protein ACSLE6_07390 [Mycobacterium sp.]